MSTAHLTVSGLTANIKRLIDSSGPLQNVWVRAEISNFKRHSRGHMYFSLKDDKSRIQSVMFAGSNKSLSFIPSDGMNVLVRGDVSVYEPYGNYQFYVKEMQPDGVGNLYLAFEQLKKKLHMAGYFDEAHKKKPPRIPERIAVITSPTGAAVRDILTTLERRYPIAKATLLPVLVQGPSAPESIAKAIKQADLANFDVIICGRGGGSIEELWAFNEEIVAKAIYQCETPLISAVGHETDVTISDYVSDLRAPTPTAAAELSVPNLTEMLAFISDRKARLIRSMNGQIEAQSERHKRLVESYAFRFPKQLIEQKEQDLDRLNEALMRAKERFVEGRTHTWSSLTQRLAALHPQDRILRESEKLTQLQVRLKKGMIDAKKEKEHQLSLQLSKLDLLSPLKLMDRGYSLVYKGNDLVKQVATVKSGDEIDVRVTDGTITGVVTHTSKLMAKEE
ncbi:exodeoxyribonuclease VII large subunit [Paenalkalicoccus suaedae]|uniref:Exodeoxyribonuclease 7 large subunit n=1 Tax=Paenalkalicoccus suaedae TaxID=2592382 RepID=A0A859FFH7_9BACI|nr:exodeoxyribonuclease VII large subunit [Paenalkalicoccus suaedae]QKS70965.1 exodeoxyribonuclease VII large subunit [Paenalkalicoccus suaedae]